MSNVWLSVDLRMDIKRIIFSIEIRAHVDFVITIMDSIVNIIGLHEHIMSLTPMSKITLIVA